MKKWRSLKRLYGKIWKISPSYLIGSAALSLLYAVHPLNGIWFFYRIINALEKNTGMETVGKDLCVMSIVELFYFAVSTYLQRKDREKSAFIRSEFVLELWQETMRIDYAELENPKLALAREKALEVFYPKQAEYMDFEATLRSVRAFVFAAVQILFFAWILAWIDIRLILPLAVSGAFCMRLKSAAIDQKQRIWSGELVKIGREISYFQEISTDFTCAKEVRLYALGDWIVKKMRNITQTYIKGIRRSVKKFSFIGVLSGLLFGFGAGVSFFLLGHFVITGIISAASLAACLNMIRNAESRLGLLTEMYVEIVQSGAYLNTYWEYMDQLEENNARYAADGRPEYASEISERAEAGGEIRFEHVSFRYPSAKTDILKDVSFRIKAGEKTALVGENGSGKTTIVKLILRLYRPNSGVIYWNGTDIAKIDYSEYIQQVTAVFQDYKIFEDTVRNNILFRRPCPEEALMRALTGAGIREKIESLPDGADTRLGKTIYENGAELSGGEKQKLVIARVLIRCASFVIMDEPTAMLSPAAEREIYMHLADLVKNKSALYISHRMSSCRFCDRILVLKEGSLCESGTHKELVKRKGEYFRLYTAQAELYMKSKEKN